MSELLVLDTGVLGIVTNPKASPEITKCQQWIKAQLQKRKYLVIPEIADYELRRELLRANKIQGLARLDALNMTSLYLPITTQAMLKAAEFWATARKQGKPTSHEQLNCWTGI
jgi:predicted nucleic acid-binding protein